MTESLKAQLLRIKIRKAGDREVADMESDNRAVMRQCRKEAARLCEDLRRELGN